MGHAHGLHTIPGITGLPPLLPDKDVDLASLNLDGFETAAIGRLHLVPALGWIFRRRLSSMSATQQQSFRNLVNQTAGRDPANRASVFEKEGAASSSDWRCIPYKLVTSPHHANEPAWLRFVQPSGMLELLLSLARCLTIIYHDESTADTEAFRHQQVFQLAIHSWIVHQLACNIFKPSTASAAAPAIPSNVSEAGPAQNEHDGHQERGLEDGLGALPSETIEAAATEPFTKLTLYMHDLSVHAALSLQQNGGFQSSSEDGDEAIFKHLKVSHWPHQWHHWQHLSRSQKAKALGIRDNQTIM